MTGKIIQSGIDGLPESEETASRAGMSRLRREGFGFDDSGGVMALDRAGKQHSVDHRNDAQTI
jgi:hypothetical protein